MKTYFFFFFLFSSSIAFAMDTPIEFLADISRFNQETTDIEDVDAELVSKLIRDIKKKWGYESLVKSPEMQPKNYLKDISLEK